MMPIDPVDFHSFTFPSGVFLLLSRLLLFSSPDDLVAFNVSIEFVCTVILLDFHE